MDISDLKKQESGSLVQTFKSKKLKQTINEKKTLTQLHKKEVHFLKHLDIFQIIFYILPKKNLKQIGKMKCLKDNWGAFDGMNTSTSTL